MNAAFDQFVFGYHDGHQLLAGSSSLDSRDLKLLLGATDMAIDGPGGPFLTGLRLATRPDYAICGTWPAPDRPRPGAVWAHVVIVPGTLLGHLVDPMTAAAALRRPSDRDLPRFTQRLNFKLPPGVTEPPVRKSLEAAVAATYGDRGERVVIESDLREAERAIAAVWRAQWPELRLAFTFRTRSTVRADQLSADIVFAQRARGTARPRTADKYPTWVRLLADAVEHPEQSALHRFIFEFGPTNEDGVRSVRALTEVFRRLGEGSVELVRQTIEKYYPERASGRELKLALFGPGTNRPWSGSEPERLYSLLSASVDAWDVEALDLASRLEALMTVQGPQSVAKALTSEATGIQQTVRSALISRACASDVAAFLPTHPHLVARVLEVHPDLLHEEAAWSGTTSDGAAALLQMIAVPDSGALVAALRAGHDNEVIAKVGLLKTARAIAFAGTFADAAQVLENREQEQLLKAKDERVVLLAVALWGRPHSAPGLPALLERQRDNADEVWLRAAVEGVADRALPAGEVLRAAFGPLHNAITGDRLPRECWVRLDGVLPPASDPALRLRRYLLDVARREQWDVELFEDALRDAGPHAGQLLNDFSGDDDWWVAAARAVVRAALTMLR